MKNIYCIIVIYNSRLSESIAYNNILNCKMNNCKVVVVDNSINGIDNSNCSSEDNNTILIAMGENIGLTKGMNVGLNYVASLEPDDEDIVILLNDDTAVTKEFFTILLNAVDEKSADIYAPIMQGQNGVYYSPCKQGFFKNSYIKSIKETPPQDRFLAIMSGTAATWGIFKDYRFDENIFMDLLDNDFCDYQRAKGRTFKKIDIVIQQNLALKNKGLTFDRIQRRYKIWIPDFLTYCRKESGRIWGFLPAIAARGIMLSYQCKNPLFWFWAMGYALKCLTKRGQK